MVTTCYNRQLDSQPTQLDEKRQIGYRMYIEMNSLRLVALSIAFLLMGCDNAPSQSDIQFSPETSNAGTSQPSSRKTRVPQNQAREFYYDCEVKYPEHEGDSLQRCARIGEIETSWSCYARCGDGGPQSVPSMKRYHPELFKGSDPYCHLIPSMCNN